MVRIASAGTLISAAAVMALVAASAGSLTVGGNVPGTDLSVAAPDDAAGTSDLITPACTSPSPVHAYAWYYHCYTPSDIRSAYGVSVGNPTASTGVFGQSQTIVLVDAYGSPTAAVHRKLDRRRDDPGAGGLHKREPSMCSWRVLSLARRHVVKPTVTCVGIEFGVKLSTRRALLHIECHARKTRTIKALCLTQKALN
jgi:hypothetical protein